MEHRMRKISKVNLIGVPWPVNLLHCSKQTNAMRPGDELSISLRDKDVKESLILIFNAQPELIFSISDSGQCTLINVKKIQPHRYINEQETL
jgi:TusA-related sulfurtransferase